MKNYREYLQFGGIMMSDEDWAIYEPRFFTEHFKKGDLIIEQGEVENYLSLVIDGFSRAYIEKDDKEITLNFVFQYGYLSSYESFLTGQPSLYTIEAMQDLTVWRVTKESFLYFFEHTSIGNYLGRLASEILYLRKSAREMSFLTENAEERYLNLFKQNPEVVKTIPLKYIASYIGITPQALSRIRKRLNY